MNEIELGAGAFWLIMASGAVIGGVSLWAFRQWSNAAKLRITINHIVAHLFELRLFSDEPASVICAQLNLFASNAALLRQVTGPSLLLSVPLLILLAGMDAFFGCASLRPEVPAIVTVEYKPGPGSTVRDLELEAPAGIQVETPPVHVARLSQVSWRIRAARGAQGKLQIHFAGHVIGKTISSVPGLQWLSQTRVGSGIGFLLHPLEWPFRVAPVESISVRYPRATIFDIAWPVWFSLAFLAGSVAYATAIYVR